MSTLTTTQIFVSSAAELMAALATATGGETIVMSAGHYGNLSLNVSSHPFAAFASEVTLTSADASNPAVFSSVALNGVSNLTFDGVTIDYEAAPGEGTWTKGFSILNSDHITISNTLFDGDLAEGVSLDADGYGTGYGLYVDQSSHITVTGSEFSQWRNGAVISNSQYLTVSGNDIHNISGDGLDFISVSNVLIEGNTLHDFHRAPTSTVHADMIQFWTQGAVTNTDITITGNILDSADGMWTQSIFMRNGAAEGASTTDMYYRNVLIENNVIHNAHGHGISVGETIGLQILNNTLLYDEDAGGTTRPGINVTTAAQDVVVSGNLLEGGVAAGSGTGWTVGNNLFVQRTDPQGPNYVGDLFVNGLNNTGFDIEHLKALPGGVIEQMGAGSALTLFDTTPTASTGFILDSAGTDMQLLTHSFDASNLFGPEGQLDTTGAVVAWDFGDGNVGTGLLATHGYADAGSYDVTAVVTLAGGETVSLSKTITVQSPLALDVDFDAGAENLVVSSQVTFEGTGDDLAARLNGGAVTFKSNDAMTGNSEYTLIVDFKRDVGSETAGGNLVYFSSSFIITLGADDLSVKITTDQGDSWIRPGNVGIADSDWHRLALTFSGSDGTAILYLDGLEVGRVSGLEGAVQVGSLSHPLYLGNPWGSGFPDLVDNFQFLGGAMSAAEIAALSTRMEDGKFAPLDGTSTQTDPVDDGSSDPVVEEETEPTVEDTILDFSGTNFDRVIIGTDGYDKLTGGNNADYIEGGAGNDFLRGQGGDDVLLAGDGADQLYGGNGNDILVGGGGTNLLDGGNGHDLLISGSGLDMMTGGRGSDTFMFYSLANSAPGGGDSITDFIRGEDKIDVSAIDAIAGGGNDAFVFIGSEAFSAAGQLRQFDFGGGIMVEGDVDGDGNADFQIALLTPGLVLTSDDFVA